MSDKNFWDFMIAAANNWKWSHTVAIVIPVLFVMGFLNKADLFRMIETAKGFF